MLSEEGKDGDGNKGDEVSGVQLPDVEEGTGEGDDDEGEEEASEEEGSTTDDHFDSLEILIEKRHLLGQSSSVLFERNEVGDMTLDDRDSIGERGWGERVRGRREKTSVTHLLF